MIDRVLEPMEKTDQIRMPRFRYWNYLSFVQIVDAANFNDYINSNERDSLVF